MCDQQSLRSTCTYAQSDQSLCLPLEYSMSVKLLTEHHLEFLSLKGGCIGSSESTLVKIPYCWKSHVVVQLYSCCHLAVSVVCHFLTAMGWSGVCDCDISTCRIPESVCLDTQNNLRSFYFLIRSER